MATYLGIDLGTSFIKGAVLDMDTLRLGEVLRAPSPEPIPGLPPLWYEIDPMRVVAATRELIERLLPRAPDCTGLVMCGQMSSLVITDPDGSPISNCISWRDERALTPRPSGSGSYYDELLSRITEEERAHMGNELRPGLPISHLFWRAQTGQLPPPGSVPASLPDFVLSQLCGSSVATEVTHACSHGAFDLETMDWHWPVLSRLGLSDLAWPPVQPGNQPFGVLDTGPGALTCFPPVGDQQCALIGVAAEPGEVWLNISTGSQASILSPRLEYGDFRTRYACDGKAYKTITHIPAGRSLGTLVELLSEIPRAMGTPIPDPWDYIAREASAVGSTDLKVNLAFFVGPCGDRGEIANIQEGNLSVGHLFRAAFENIADNCHAVASRLDPGGTWTRLVLSGGPVRRLDLLRKLLAERFGLEYRLAASSEDTLLGLLALALANSGRAGSLDEATEILGRVYRE